MSFGHLIQDMRGTLDKLQALSSSIRPATAEEMSEAAAMEQLSAANNGRYCTIRHEITRHDSGRVVHEWTAYTSDPPEWWKEAPTLFEAIANAVKGKLAQVTADDLADVPTAPLPEAAIPVGSEVF